LWKLGVFEWNSWKPAKILIVRLTLFAHRFPVPIQHCLVARLRRVGFAQFFGEAPIIVFAGSVIVGHDLLLLRCLTSSAIAIASTQFVPGGFVSGRGSTHPGVGDGSGPLPPTCCEFGIVPLGLVGARASRIAISRSTWSGTALAISSIVERGIDMPAVGSYR
jgi:hypothetical protein